MLAVFLGLYPLICLSHTFCTCKTSTLPPLLTLVQIRWIDGREICLERLSEPHEYKACRIHTSAGAPHQPSQSASLSSPTVEVRSPVLSAEAGIWVCRPPHSDL